MFSNVSIQIYCISTDFNNKSMSAEESGQMYRRIFRKRQRQCVFLLTLVSVVLIWVNFHLPGSLSDRVGICDFPCVGSGCVECKVNKEENKGPSINIFEKLKLKQAFRDGNTHRTRSRVDSDQICKRPNFDLKHDSVKYAFHSMDTLNCTGQSLFKVDKGIFKIEDNVLKGRELEKCEFYGIERVSDDFSTFSEPYTKDTEPFSLVIKQDFVRIKCFLKKENETESVVEGRKLLHLSSNKTTLYFDIYKQQAKDGSHINSGLSDNLSDLSKATARSFNSSVKTNKLQFERDSLLSIGHKEKPEKKATFVRGLKEAVESEDKSSDTEVVIDNEITDINMEERYETLTYEDYYGYNSIEKQADFDQFIVQVYPKPAVHDRIIKQIQKVKGKQLSTEEMPVNVLMIGLDSMSHMSYQRKLPKTYRYLRDVLKAVILDGYNIVGDATTAAILPMLTGKPETELPEARKKWVDSHSVNKFPLIWNDFRDQGYVTMLAEDEPSIGVFNLRLNGFDTPPTDHYMRPFWTSLWDSELRRSSPRFCTGNTPNHMFLLNYTRSFFDAYKNVSKFAFVFGSELTHWNNNPGEYMDSDFVDLLKYLQAAGHLKNTVLIVFADHGARYSAVRNTVQGKLEERLPMMSLVLPDQFKQKYPLLHENLIINSDKLATPFDIYETLKHVVFIEKTWTRYEHIMQKQKVPRGISLLHPIPLNRTCAMAEIELHWCTCLKQVELHLSDIHVQKSITAVIKQINAETEFLRGQCAELSLKKLHSAFLLIPNEQVLMFQKTKDEDNRIANFSSNVNIDHTHFQVTVETVPNHGVFEATVQVNITAGTYLVMDGVSRLDMYGNQPACVQDRYPDLRKYCYCRNGDQ